jgi:hypothetical protein
MKIRKNSRTSKYVNSVLIQGNLMWRFMTYWVVYNIALVVTMLGDQLVVRIPDMLTGNSTFNFGELLSTFGAANRPLFLAMAIFCPLLLWDMMRYTHRIAGPLYRFRKAMEDHINGEPLAAVKLRDGDLLKEFQDTYNKFIAHVELQKTQAARVGQQPAAHDKAEREVCESCV